MFDSQVTTKAAPSKQQDPAPSASSVQKKALKGMSYAAGSASVSPAVQAKAGGGLLTPGQVSSAISYNNKRGFSEKKIKQYQKVVGTTADGDIGPKTCQAVAKFQKNHNLGVDGKIGPATQGVLDKHIGPEQAPPPKPDNTPPASPPPTPGGLTAHFSWAEFASHDGAPTPQSVRPEIRELAEYLEVLRTACGGKAIKINSGYRSPAHNKAVGGASNSQHLYGRAADIVVSGMTPSQVKAKIESLINSGKMKQGGVGLYSSFVHYDTRGSAARW